MIFKSDHLQFHLRQSCFHAMIGNFNMTRFVTYQLAISADVTLLANSQWNARSASGTRCPALI